MSSAARTLVSGDPEPLTVYVHAYDASGRHMCTVGAKSPESARALLSELDAAELVYLRGPGVPDRVWRDSRTRQWRSR